jgi:hypothetical protein
MRALNIAATRPRTFASAECRVMLPCSAASASSPTDSTTTAINTSSRLKPRSCRMILMAALLPQYDRASVHAPGKVE